MLLSVYTTLCVGFLVVDAISNSNVELFSKVLMVFLSFYVASDVSLCDLLEEGTLNVRSCFVSSVVNVCS